MPLRPSLWVLGYTHLKHYGSDLEGGAAECELELSRRLTMVRSHVARRAVL